MDKSKIFFVYQKLPDDAKQSIFNFWVKNDALPSVEVALKRLNEVCVIAVDERNDLIGEFTVYIDYIDNKPYFFTRIFIEREHEGGYILMQEITKLAFSRLKSNYLDKAEGLVLNLENTKFAHLGSKTNYFQKIGYTYHGLSKKGHQLWFVRFDNPQGIYK